MTVIVVVVVAVAVIVVVILIVVESRSIARIRSRWFAVCHGLRHEAGGVRQTEGVERRA